MRAVSKVLAVVAILLAGTGLIGIGYTYTSSTDNTDNTVVSEYVVLTQTNYTFNDSAIFATDEITMPYTDFTSVITSLDGDNNTKIRITVSDRDKIDDYGIVKFFVSSTIDGDRHYAGFILTVTDVADTTPTITVDDNTIGSGTIGAAAGSGEYRFILQISGMKSQSTAKVSAETTLFILNGTDNLTAISGTDYSGKSLGTSALTADHSISTVDIKVRLASTGFKDLTDSGWIYVLVLTREGEASQYAYSIDGSNWSYAANGSLVLKEDKQYTSSLYLAGTKETDSSAYSWKDVPRTNGYVINNGKITFTYDSEN